MTSRFIDHLLDGTHAARPAATAVPTGTLYSCSDHSLVYQSDGAVWATWATLGGGAAAFVGVKAYRNAALNIANATATAIPWDTEQWDTDTFHDNVTNPSRLTVPTGQAGKYLLTVSVGFVAGFLANRVFIQGQVNAAAIRGAQHEMTGSDVDTYYALSISTVLDLAVADYVEVIVYQDSGAARAMYVATASNGITLTKLG